MDFELSGRSEQWRNKLQAFFDAEVLPRHRAWLEHTASNACAFKCTRYSRLLCPEVTGL